jgi:hypothetical protein
LVLNGGGEETERKPRGSREEAEGGREEIERMLRGSRETAVGRLRVIGD